MDQYQYGYDKAGNRIYRDNLQSSTRSELYTHDDLHRLATLGRGTLNEGKTALTASTFAQAWTLDSLGNQRAFHHDANGDGDLLDGGDLEQTRAHNPANETTGIAGVTSGGWETPAYDKAGNTITIPQPKDMTKTFTGKFDAWNRLVKLTEVVDSVTQTVSEYAYDGLHRRITQKTYTAGTLSETRHYYYNASWQVIEERVGSSTDPNRQFIWDLRYIDALILRDRDTDANGSLDETLYAMQDANFNVTAYVNTTSAGSGAIRPATPTA